MHAAMISPFPRCVSLLIYIFLSVYLHSASQFALDEAKKVLSHCGIFSFSSDIKVAIKNAKKPSPWNFPASGSPRFASWEYDGGAPSADFWRDWMHERCSRGKGKYFYRRLPRRLPRLCCCESRHKLRRIFHRSKYDMRYDCDIFQKSTRFTNSRIIKFMLISVIKPYNIYLYPYFLARKYIVFTM